MFFPCTQATQPVSLNAYGGLEGEINHCAKPSILHHHLARVLDYHSPLNSIVCQHSELHIDQGVTHITQHDVGMDPQWLNRDS